MTHDELLLQSKQEAPVKGSLALPRRSVPAQGSGATGAPGAAPPDPFHSAYGAEEGQARCKELISRSVPPELER